VNTSFCEKQRASDFDSELVLYSEHCLHRPEVEKRLLIHDGLQLRVVQL